MEHQALQSQIFIFNTLQDFSNYLDNELRLYNAELSRYEDELGSMLRQAEQTNSEEEWIKEMKIKLGQDKNPAPTAGEKKERRKDARNEKHKKEKKERSKTSQNWVNYRDIQIFTGKPSQGKTEVYFDAVNELKAGIEKLNKAKETVTQLASAGIANAFYLVYLKNGMPEKLVLLPQEQQETKFEFTADFITENVEVPIESREV